VRTANKSHNRHERNVVQQANRVLGSTRVIHSSFLVCSLLVLYGSRGNKPCLYLPNGQ
jgi:hypothetical protein